MEKTRKEFIQKVIQKETSLSELCREYGISRPTAYKWIARFKNGEGLEDKSHEAYFKPRKTSVEKEELILYTREEHPTWGPRKIKRSLENKGFVELPATSTIADILKRNNCISKEASDAHTPWKRFEKEEPNEMWQMDHKGNFGLSNGIICYPMTILDDCSRFSLCINAKDNERWLPTKNCLVTVFREYGLPKSILSDNGNPWGSGGKGYTMFDVWMMQMNVLPIHGRILHPQTQGKDERFHRTLKEDVLKRTILRDLDHAQEEFDKFRYCYNYERPHESLGLDVPAKHYKPSKREYIENPQEPEYDTGKTLRKVNYKGYISIDKHRYFLSDSLINKYIEIVPTSEKSVNLCYGEFAIAKVDTEEKKIISKRIYRR
ncbi:MAG: IS481 family transposase [Clostridia bacterium]|nr:IS481 family transposase [Clostridia bacterium]